jgi:hypothetical protein
MTSQQRNVSTLPIDQRGHIQIHSPEHLRAEQTGFVKDGLASGAAAKWMNPAFIYDGAFNCSLCDAYPSFSVAVDDAGEPMTLVAKTACALTEGLPMVVELAVPSGKMIVTDDLRPVFDFDLLNYNSLAGQAEAQQIMAVQGCAYGPVGNSSPSLIKTGDGTYVIASFDDELGPEDEGYVAGEQLADICTDLWAYSIADLDHFVGTAREKFAAASDKERVKLLQRDLFSWAVQPGDPRERIDQLGWTVTIVDVAPGVYRFTHHTGEAGFDRDAWPVVYAHVDVVG